MAYQSDLSIDAIDPDTSDIDDEKLQEYNEAYIEIRDKLIASLSNMVPQDQMEDVVQYAYLLGIHRNAPEKCHTSMKNLLYSIVKTIGTKYKTANYEGGSSKYCSLETQNDNGDQTTLLDLQSDAIQPSEWMDFTPYTDAETEAIEGEKLDELKEQVNEAFQWLTEYEQKVMLLTECADKSIAFVADHCDSTVSSMSTIKTNARKKLKHHLSKRLNRIDWEV